MTLPIAITLALLLLADWSQTVDVVQKKREVNPVIGPDGRRVSPAIYFPLAIVILGAAVLLLPAPWGERAGLLAIGSEGCQVWLNRGSGYKFKWWWA